MNQSTSTQHKQILLVENSQTAKAIISKLLTKKGYQVSSVSTGEEAVNIFQEQPFDLIIMDVFLPKLNGYEATEKIRALKTPQSRIPIIALTSSKSEFDEKRCLEAGMSDYIIKSADNAKLLERISDIFNQ